MLKFIVILRLILKYIMNLDKPSDFLKDLDPGQVGDSITCLPDQIEQNLQDAEAVSIPQGYRNVNKVVLSGMGGSNLGTRMIQSVFKDSLSVPVIISAGYEVPGYVDEKTLFILSSYSGTTEETLSVYDETKKRGAKMLAVTASQEGNKLEKLMESDGLPGFAFRPLKNPSGQPRLGLGYSVFSLLAVFDKLGLLKLDKKEVFDSLEFLRQENRSWEPESLSENNEAKQIAEKLKNKIPVLIGAEFLEGNLHTFRNQICENSKNFSVYFDLPDLNHFLLEGLPHPLSNSDHLKFLFIESDYYSESVRKRSELTKQVVEKIGMEVVAYKARAESKIGQSLELLQLGSWVSFYLAVLNKENPSLIPWVDWFKEKLKD